MICDSSINEGVVYLLYRASYAVGRRANFQEQQEIDNQTSLSMHKIFDCPQWRFRASECQCSDTATRNLSCRMRPAVVHTNVICSRNAMDYAAPESHPFTETPSYPTPHIPCSRNISLSTRHKIFFCFFYILCLCACALCTLVA